jgi:hypothetical protein
MKNIEVKIIRDKHDKIFLEIHKFFLDTNINKDINKQVDIFYKDPTYKNYKGVRTDKGYKKWKEEVIKRFESQCCICYSKDKLVSHHLFSYKYYDTLRTELNNGVCLCNTCHELFNFAYSNINTLEQFLSFRKKFIGKSYKYIKTRTQSGRVLMTEALLSKSNKIIENPKVKISKEQQQKIDKVISSFEELKKKLLEEKAILEQKYGSEKGIRIIFRGKETTSLSAIAKLFAENMRLNTLISANKVADKNIMASKFHMPHDEFCKKLQNPQEYLSFTASEITHLNKILHEDYRK